jgi:hypothetical protein
MEIKMKIDSTVDDLVSKIVIHAKIPASKIHIYRIAFKNYNFNAKSIRMKNCSQRLFNSNNYEESYLVRFSDEEDLN